MNENQDFEENYYYSRKATRIYKVGVDSFRLMKWICYFDRFYHENRNYYDLMGSVLKRLNEISEWSIF